MVAVDVQLDVMIVCKAENDPGPHRRYEQSGRRKGPGSAGAYVEVEDIVNARVFLSHSPLQTKFYYQLL